MLYDSYTIKEFLKKNYPENLRILSKVLNVNVTSVGAYRGGSWQSWYQSLFKILLPIHRRQLQYHPSKFMSSLYVQWVKWNFVWQDNMADPAANQRPEHIPVDPPERDIHVVV